MLAERAADLVRGREPMAPADVPVGLVEDWQDQQRSRAPRREVRTG